MHAHLTQVVAEPRFHESARGRVEGLAGQSQDFMDEGRRMAGRLIRPSHWRERRALQGLFLLSAIHAICTGRRVIAAGARALQNPTDPPEYGRNRATRYQGRA